MRPRSIAIVGASDDPSAIGGAPIVNLTAFGTGAELHLVSRSRTSINGRRCLPAIAALPAGVDCALLVVPADAAAAALADCGERGVRAAIVFASGFAETGETGALGQDELRQVAERYEMAVAGPNCLGLMNFVEGIPLTFGAIAPHPVPPGGGLGLVAQSGAMTMALTYAAHAEGVPVSFAVSTGNEAVVTLEDYLAFLLEDTHTRCIAVLAEQIRHPVRFRRLAARARAIGKPLVLLHAGREGAAADAARSHTGALAADHAVMETVLRADGVVMVNSLDELVDAAGMLTRFAMPVSPGLGMVTDSGSVRTLTLDLAEALGVHLAELQPRTTARLTDALPAFAAIGNPVDITAQGLNKPALYAEAVAALLEDDGVGALLVAAMPGSDRQTGDQVNALLPAIHRAAKPVVYVLMGGGHPVPGGHDARLRAAGVPVLRSPERALRALGRIAASTAAPSSTTVDAAFPVSAVTTTLTEHQSKALLERYGLPVPQRALVRSAAAAAAAAEEVGFPVALKAQAPSMMHKTEAGGITVALADQPQLRAAYDEMSLRLGGVADLEGYLVEAMAEPGLELILGARRDPEWGVVLVAGFGGVLTELLDDVVLFPASVDSQAITAGLARLRGSRLLYGFRRSRPVDVEAVVASVQAISRLMRDEATIVEVDFNPLRAYEQGVLVLDASIVISGSAIGVG